MLYSFTLFSLYLSDIVKKERDERKGNKGRVREEGRTEREREELGIT